MWHVILGRVVCGLGGSAMTVATALLITGISLPPASGIFEC